MSWWHLWATVSTYGEWENPSSLTSHFTCSLRLSEKSTFTSSKNKCARRIQTIQRAWKIMHSWRISWSTFRDVQPPDIIDNEYVKIHTFPLMWVNCSQYVESFIRTYDPTPWIPEWWQAQHQTCCRQQEEFVYTWHHAIPWPPVSNHTQKLSPKTWFFQSVVIHLDDVVVKLFNRLDSFRWD